MSRVEACIKINTSIGAETYPADFKKDDFRTCMSGEVVSLLFGLVNDRFTIAKVADDAKGPILNLKVRFAEHGEKLGGLHDTTMQITNIFDEPAYESAGKYLGLWTAVQACTRDLKPGETRAALCKKVKVGLALRRHAIEPKVLAHLEELA